MPYRYEVKALQTISNQDNEWQFITMTMERKGTDDMQIPFELAQILLQILMSEVIHHCMFVCMVTLEKCNWQYINIGCKDCIGSPFL